MCKHSVSDNGQPVFSPLPDTSSAAGGGADSGIGLSPQVGSREATSAGAASSSSQSSSATSSSQSPHPQQSSFTTDSGNDSLHTNTSTGNQSLESITSIPGTKKDARRYRHLALKVVARRPLGVQEGLILREPASCFTGNNCIHQFRRLNQWFQSKREKLPPPILPMNPVVSRPMSGSQCHPHLMCWNHGSQQILPPLVSSPDPRQQYYVYILRNHRFHQKLEDATFRT